MSALLTTVTEVSLGLNSLRSTLVAFANSALQYLGLASPSTTPDNFTFEALVKAVVAKFGQPVADFIREAVQKALEQHHEQTQAQLDKISREVRGLYDEEGEGNGDISREVLNQLAQLSETVKNLESTKETGPEMPRKRTKNARSRAAGAAEVLAPTEPLAKIVRRVLWELIGFDPNDKDAAIPPYNPQIHNLANLQLLSQANVQPIVTTFSPDFSKTVGQSDWNLRWLNHVVALTIQALNGGKEEVGAQDPQNNHGTISSAAKKYFEGRVRDLWKTSQLDDGARAQKIAGEKERSAKASRLRTTSDRRVKAARSAKLSDAVIVAAAERALHSTEEDPEDGEDGVFVLRSSEACSPELRLIWKKCEELHLLNLSKKTHNVNTRSSTGETRAIAFKDFESDHSFPSNFFNSEWLEDLGQAWKERLVADEAQVDLGAQLQLISKAVDDAKSKKGRAANAMDIE